MMVMKVSMLQIQQYLELHPVLKKDEKIRYKYIVLLGRFVDALGGNGIWTKQMLGFYAKKIIGQKVSLKELQAADLRILEKLRFFHYRYFLLIDCLFLCCFDDEERGQKVLDDIVAFFGERYRKKLTVTYGAFFSITESQLIQRMPELHSVFKVIWKNREYLSKKEKRIMITANMSAGKSTLLNALVGKKINKTQNDTCTAKIHYIYNKAGEDGLNSEWDHDLELDASLDILMDDNEANNTTDIIVGTRFRSITEIEGKICFIDTPGVNSSMNKGHRDIVNEAIRSVECDLLLYLFNGENIGSDDDVRHLKYVKDNYQGRIVFLVNRLDHYKKGVDSVSDTIEKEKKDLIRLGFKDPEIYPISAYAAYLAKMSLYGELLSEAELEELGDLKRILKKEEFSYEKYYSNVIDNREKATDSIYQLLLHSGILALEEIIYNT